MFPYELDSSHNNAFDLAKDLEKVFMNKEFSDIVVKCGNISFAAHKVILASRSPVFKTLLKANLEMKIKHAVYINDVNPEVMAEMLRFMYTGKAFNLDKIGMDLLIAAEKYQMKSLKEVCEKKFIRSNNIGNYFSLLIMGHKNSSNVKKAVLKFVVKKRKSVDIDKRLLEYPSLMMELLKEFTGDGTDDYDEDDEEYIEEVEEEEEDEEIDLRKLLREKLTGTLSF